MNSETSEYTNGNYTYPYYQSQYDFTNHSVPSTMAGPVTSTFNNASTTNPNTRSHSHTPPKRQRSSSQPHEPTHLGQPHPYVSTMTYQAPPEPRRQRTLSVGADPLSRLPYVESAGQTSVDGNGWIASPVSAGPGYQFGGMQGPEMRAYMQPLQVPSSAGLDPSPFEHQSQPATPYAYHPYRQQEQPVLHHPQPRTPLIPQLESNLPPLPNSLPGPQAVHQHYAHQQPQPHPQSLRNAHPYPSEYQHTQTQLHHYTQPQSYNHTHTQPYNQPHLHQTNPGAPSRPRPEPPQPTQSLPVYQREHPFINHSPLAPGPQINYPPRPEPTVEPPTPGPMYHHNSAIAPAPSSNPTSERGKGVGRGRGRSRGRGRGRGSEGNILESGGGPCQIRFVGSEKTGQSNLGQGLAATSKRAGKGAKRPSISISRGRASEPNVLRPMLSAELSPHRRVVSEGNIGTSIPSHEDLVSAPAPPHDPSYLFPPSQNQNQHTPVSGPSHSPVCPAHQHLEPPSFPHIQAHCVPPLPQLHHDDVSTPGSCTTTAPNTPYETLLTPIGGGSQPQYLASFSSGHSSDAGSFGLMRRGSGVRRPIQHAKSPLAKTVYLPQDSALYSPGEGEARRVASETRAIQEQASSGQAQAQSQSEARYYEGQSYPAESDHRQQPGEQHQPGTTQQRTVEQPQTQVHQYIQSSQYARSQSQPQQRLAPYQPAQGGTEIQHTTQALQGLGLVSHPDQIQLGPVQQSVQRPKRARNPSQAPVERAPKKQRATAPEQPPNKNLVTAGTSGPENVVVRVEMSVTPDSQFFDFGMWQESSGLAVPGVGCGEGVKSVQHTQAQGQATKPGSSEMDICMETVACEGVSHPQAGAPSYNDLPRQQASSSTNLSTQAVSHNSMQTHEAFAPAVPAGMFTWGLTDPDIQPGPNDDFEWKEIFDLEDATADDCSMNTLDEVATQSRPIVPAQPASNDISTAPVGGPSSCLPAHVGGSEQVGLAKRELSHQVGQDPKAMLPPNAPTSYPLAQEPALPQPGFESDVNQIYDFDGGDSWNVPENQPS